MMLTQGALRARKRRGHGAGQGPPQVAVGIGMLAGELRAGKAKNVLDEVERGSARQQVSGNPEIHDAPVGMREAFQNAPLADALGVNVSGPGGIERRGRSGETIQRDRGGTGYSQRVQQGAGARRQAWAGGDDLDPRCVAARCAPGWLLIGEPCQAAQMAPVRARHIAVIEPRQLPASSRGGGGFQRASAELDPGLQMPWAGLDHHTGMMAVRTHGLNHRSRGLVQIDENVAGILAARVGHNVDVTAFPVAGAQETDRGRGNQLPRRPEPLAGHGSPGGVVDQANQVQVVGHRCQLPANGLQGKKKSAVFHDRHLAARTSRRTMDFQSAANSVLTACLTPGAHFSSPL